MTSPTIRFLEKKELPQILPLVQMLNPKIPFELLEKRMHQMTDTSYKCVAVFIDGKIVAICGVWENVRFYSGLQIEIDNVIVDENFRSQNLGKKLMQWIYDYARSISCNSVELNTYVGNPRSHKFYYNEGFVILGFHMKKEM